MSSDISLICTSTQQLHRGKDETMIGVESMYIYYLCNQEHH